jgi:hypothetical protein
MRIGRASIWCCLILAGVTAAVATTPVQFFDPTGNLIVNEQVTVTNPSEKLTTVLPPEQDGTYDVPGNLGEQLEFVIGDAAVSTRAVRAKLAQNQPGQPMNVVVPMGGPANDDCAAAQAIAVPSTTSGTTVGAAVDGVAACGGQAQTAPGVWYSLTGGGTNIQLTTCTGFGGSASYDTKISVYCQGCDLAGQVCVAANDDGPAANCPAFQSPFRKVRAARSRPRPSSRVRPWSTASSVLRKSARRRAASTVATTPSAPRSSPRTTTW